MKTIIAAAIAGAAYAGKIHEFMAESHLICNLCHDVLDNIQNEDRLEELYTLFPGLQRRMDRFFANPELVSLLDI
jgi:hypothetical protein